MSSEHTSHQRNSTGRQPPSAHRHAQEKRQRSVSSDEGPDDGLAKRARTMTRPFVKLSHEAYAVGWVCALPLEMAAARAMLDKEHQSLEMNSNDNNVYTFGSIGPYNIVVACLPSGQYGTNSAAIVANNMRWSFPSIYIGLMVGIGGGVPGKDDIRLGDVVVSNPTADSPGVIQYDFGKAVNDGQFKRIGCLNKPPQLVLAAVSRLRAEHEIRPSQIPAILAHMRTRNPDMIEYSRQGVDEDRLFEASYEHPGESACCDNCDRSRLVTRTLRPTNNPSIHYGIIASGNQVMKHAGTRDRLAKDLGSICFEMEAAGLMDNFPCLVIRGICDYSDSHKAKRWQRYAAATAAAYAKELLLIMPPQGISTTARQPEVQTIVSPSPDRKKLLDSLKFDQINQRHANIRTNNAKTCEWLLGHPAYTAWIDRNIYSKHHGFLWIKGKPGAGKSTIMKFAFAQARSGATSMGTSISFFFNARGVGLEKSTLGMYRSLMHQLLEKMPDLQVLLDVHDDTQESVVWNLEKTKTLFRSAIRELGQQQLTCFIDALDECAEDEIRDMVVVFEDLGQYAAQKDLRFYVCLSSRHYPYIDIQYGQQLVLEDQLGHQMDLAEYVRNNLKAGKGSTSMGVVTEILRKASGVFMWVVLVVEILNKEYRGGRAFKIKSRLREIPSKLSELFQNMLTRDQENLDDLLLCIQWVLYSARPLTREEFYFALASGLEPDAIEKWNPNEIPYDFMDRLIVSSSKGIAETTRSRDQTVQFIHESVRDFLLKDNGLRNLWPDLDDDFEAQSHNRLRDCCHAYLKQVEVYISVYLPENGFLLSMPEEVVRAYRFELKKGFPFLEYATNYVLHHSNTASRSDSQGPFLEQFPTKQWIQQSNLFQEYSEERHQPKSTSLLYVAAGRGLRNVVETLLRQNQDPEIHGGRHGYPLLAALIKGHAEVAELFLKHTISPVTQGRSASYNIPESEVRGQAAASINGADKGGRTPLFWATWRGLVNIAKTLLDLGASINIRPEDDPINPLVHAAGEGQEQLVRLFLQQQSKWQPSVSGGDISPQSPPHIAKYKVIQRALLKAAETGNMGTLRILLETGVSVNNGYDPGSTPLDAAIQNSRVSSIELLLDNGADIHRQNSERITPIHCAVRNGSQTVVRLLIRRGCDVEARGASGQTPLHLACQIGGNSELLELLLGKGAHIHAQDDDGNTPLFAAISHDRAENLELLLRHSILEHQRGSGETTFFCEESLQVYGNGHSDFRHMVNKFGQTLLFAARPYSKSLLDELLQRGLDPKWHDNAGQTFLHNACKQGRPSSQYIEGIKKAVDKGLDIDGRDNEGRSPLMNAAKSLDLDFVDILLRQGADPKARDNNGRTPLSDAVNCTEREAWDMRTEAPVIQRLLEGGADITESGPKGESLDDMALRLGKIDLFFFLSETTESIRNSS